MNWKILRVGTWAGISLLCWSAVSWAAPGSSFELWGRGDALALVQAL